jgi:hypothetical protein
LRCNKRASRFMVFANAREEATPVSFIQQIQKTNAGVVYSAASTCSAPQTATVARDLSRMAALNGRLA